MKQPGKHDGNYSVHDGNQSLCPLSFKNRSPLSMPTECRSGIVRLVSDGAQDKQRGPTPLMLTVNGPYE